MEVLRLDRRLLRRAVGRVPAHARDRLPPAPLNAHDQGRHQDPDRSRPAGRDGARARRRRPALRGRGRVRRLRRQARDPAAPHGLRRARREDGARDPRVAAQDPRFMRCHPEERSDEGSPKRFLASLGMTH